MSSVDDICNELTAAVTGNQYTSDMLVKLAAEAFPGNQILPIQKALEDALAGLMTMQQGYAAGGYFEPHCNGDDPGMQAVALQMRDNALQTAVQSLRQLLQPSAALA